LNSPAGRLSERFKTTKMTQEKQEKKKMEGVWFLIILFSVIFLLIGYLKYSLQSTQKRILRDCDSTMAYIEKQGYHKGSYTNYIYVVNGKEYTGSYRGKVRGDSIRVYYSKQNPWTNTVINDSGFFAFQKTYPYSR